MNSRKYLWERIEKVLRDNTLMGAKDRDHVTTEIMNVLDEEGKGDKLVADIVQRNVDDLAATNDKLIQYQKDRAVKIAEAFLKLYDAVSDSQVVDRKLLAVQKSLDVSRGLGLAQDLEAEKKGEVVGGIG